MSTPYKSQKSVQSVQPVITEPYVDFKTKELVCPWCHKREAMLLPQSTHEMARTMFQFNLAHQDCEKLTKRQPL